MIRTDPKILIIRMSSLGDIIIAAPVFRSLKAKWPCARVDILVKPEFAQAISGNAFVSNVLTFTGLRAALGEINAVRYDVIIDLHATPRSRLICMAARAPLKLRYYKASLARKLFVYFRIRSSVLQKHTVDRYLDALAPLGVRPVYSAADMPDWPPDNGQPLVCAQVKAGINTGSAWPTKRWPQEKWAHLIRRLAVEYGAKVLLVGSPGEAQWNSEIEKLAGPEHCLNLTGKTSLSELISVIRPLKVFISNDSGPMHIAAALGVPTVGIFGPTTRELGFFPRGSASRVVETALACRPCALHGAKTCPRGHFLCMNLLTVDQVFAAAAGKAENPRYKEGGTHNN